MSDDLEGSLRIVFAGTPEFSVPALDAIAESGHTLVGVITNPDRPAGRGKKPRPPAVKQAALDQDVPVYQPESMKGEQPVQRLRAWEPDVMVVAAYGQILPETILQAPTYGCVNIHASLLPKYRGAAPINRAIIEGESESGITIMKMDEGLDTGPMLMKGSVPIGPEMTAGELHDELAQLGATLIVDALDRLAEGTLSETPQDDEQASYAPKLATEDGRIDWSQPARRVADLIRGLNPWPGAFSHIEADGGSDRIKFHLAHPVDTPSDEPPGTVLRADAKAGELVIACGEEAVAVDRIQAPGGRAMDAGDFLNGYPLQPGDRFGADTD
jgi:methionyl-tRNA formyltransferase